MAESRAFASCHELIWNSPKDTVSHGGRGTPPGGGERRTEPREGAGGRRSLRAGGGGCAGQRGSVAPGEPHGAHRRGRLQLYQRQSHDFLGGGGRRARAVPARVRGAAQEDAPARQARQDEQRQVSQVSQRAALRAEKASRGLPP